MKNGTDRCYSNAETTVVKLAELQMVKVDPDPSDEHAVLLQASGWHHFGNERFSDDLLTP